jgi:secondary thiamine-phosphate synthase enzyme
MVRRDPDGRFRAMIARRVPAWQQAPRIGIGEGGSAHSPRPDSPPPPRQQDAPEPWSLAMQTTLTIRTSGPGLHEFTAEAARFVRESGVDEGLLTLFVQHTSCSLCIQENADPDVRRDLDEFFRRLVPPTDEPSMRWVRHTTEGRDDMPAHIKAALNAVSLSIPVTAGRLALGTWQGIYLFEHRDRPQTRRVVAHLND